MTNFELELTNALGKSPIEEYIKQLQKDADAGFQSYQLKARQLSEDSCLFAHTPYFFGIPCNWRENRVQYLY